MRNLFIVLGLICFSFFFLESCQKKEAAPKNPEFLQTGKKLDITVAAIDGPLARHAPACSGQGGQVGIGVSWDIATCKSNCERGIGFRCSREIYAVCANGAHQVLQHHPGSCRTARATIDQPGRQMSAKIELYDNGTARIIFQKPMVESEKTNLNFEVEENPDLEIPDYWLIGGQQYNYLRFVPGTYSINYSDGSHGSVVVSVQYIR